MCSLVLPLSLSHYLKLYDHEKKAKPRQPAVVLSQLTGKKKKKSKMGKIDIFAQTLKLKKGPFFFSKESRWLKEF